jgi:NADPH:quinone reductase-like Zn-dependent oxidoreductase
VVGVDVRRVVHRRCGGPEVLEIEQVDVPEPGEGQVLVRVEAAGVNLPGIRQTHASPEGGGVPLPCTPGGDVAGLVERVGAGVTGFEVGQRVTGLTFAGALAEFTVTPAPLLTPIPDGVDLTDALILGRSGLVAIGVLTAGRVAAGESVLVTSAASAIGHLAVQLAKAEGAARVVGAVRTADKADFVLGVGADRVVTYAEHDWGERVDVVLDGTGGPVLSRSVEALATFGRLVSFSAADGQVDVYRLRAESRTLTGFSIAHVVRQRPQAVAAYRARLWELLAQGALRPVVHASVPLGEVADAYRLVESGTTCGKVVVLPGK